MGEWENKLPAKPNDLNSLLGTHKEEEENCLKFFSDHHISVLAPWHSNECHIPLERTHKCVKTFNCRVFW